MYELRSGQRPMRSRPLAVCLVIIGSALLMSGCSSTRTPASGAAVYSWLLSEPPPPPAFPVKRDLEDDGMEAQSPPSSHVRLMPDDPTQPWSRNYGGPRAAEAISASPVYTGEPQKAPVQGAGAGPSQTVVASDE